jgi:lipoprotein-anchoring transpeptidase ErfK/SrfK
VIVTRSGLAVTALLLAAALGVAGCSGSAVRAAGKSGGPTSGGAPAGSSALAAGARTSSPSSSSATSTAPAGPRRGSGTPVHVSLYEGDGTTYGVAMPIIAYFSADVTDARVFDQVARVSVNGVAAHGAWYWEQSSQSSSSMEAHYRLAGYWPAHATIHLDLPVKGLWAGQGRVFDDSLSLTMHTGARHIVKIDGKPGLDSMKAYSDGTLVRKVKVSLGAAETPTYLGTAVVISKSNPELMKSSPGEAYYSIEVPWSVRVTYDGEFLHDAYWNNQLGQVNLSHGCTNLSPAVAKWYYHWSRVGDPVTWTHTGTKKVLPVWDGWGDWNVSFATYRHGGLLAP